ncbi:MAG: hypothetical protein HZA61_04610 [Candidatus Eisenbacteria bacterium]|uniref:Uncharacterized protein n=1 Tax=Eiseniibacteriota bacterium TaxID=2212470 RepID=A0A933SBI2_UNCEI|nr:hypothetical protein [Candidatus Eisenbacteria bacterium]
MNSLWIVAFILFDVLVTAAVLLVVIRRRGGVAGAIGFDPKQAMGVSRELEADAEQYLRANWSGDSTTLPQALTGLLDRVESKLAAEHLELDRERLKPIVLQIVTAKHLADARDAREAMKKVA